VGLQGSLSPRALPDLRGHGRASFLREAFAPETVVPGKGGLGTFAPRLDAAEKSVKGQLVARDLSRSLGLDLFLSEPLPEPGT